MNAAVVRALAGGVLDARPHAAIFYDLDRVEERMHALSRAFPAGTLHALAVKACPITSLLRFTAERGLGAEVASFPELKQALRAGVPPERIVFDSPAKTRDELRDALSMGVGINADNLQELARLATIVPGYETSHGAIGVRLNPEAGPGFIEATSTAMRGSKFGVTMFEHRAALIEAFENHPWLTAVHAHTGSQGCSLDLLLESVERVMHFIEEVETRCGRGRIQVVDIGGGLSVAYRQGEGDVEFQDYARALDDRCPRLFAGEFRLVTEFGRAIWAHAAVAVSRVEYTKVSGGRRIATVHLGADMFPRTAYVPDVWFHGLSVLDPKGRPKDAPVETQDIAGPLCFSGDLLARARPLPRIEEGDFVVVHDVGAYTFSMWSRYNSRLSPPVYGVNGASGQLALLRRGEQVDDVVGFWD